MQIGQILKDEKKSLSNFLYFRVGTLQEHNSLFFINLQSLYRFFIKHSPLMLYKFLLKENNIDCLTGQCNKPSSLRIEICSDKMNELLAQRKICAADIRCLDKSSKQCLKKLCLKTCLYNTVSSNPVPQLQEDTKLADPNLAIEELSTQV